MRARIKTLSKGQERQVALLWAVSHRPDLLLLDEPAGGLDPAARREFLETSIQLLNEAGTTILFSSHHMTDVERLADGIVMGGNPRRKQQTALSRQSCPALLPLPHNRDELDPLHRLVDGPGVTTFPIIILCAGLVWFAMIAVYLRSFRAGISDVARKMTLISLLVVVLGLHTSQYIALIGERMDLWVITGLWVIFIRRLGDLLPGGAPTLWLLCLLLVAGAYRSTLASSERIEIPGRQTGRA